MTKNNLKYILKIIAVIGLLIFLHYLKIIAPLENLIIKVVEPISSRFYSVGSDLQVTYDEKMNKTQLLNAIKILEAENHQLKAENSNLKSVGEENHKLKEHLNFLEANNYKYLLSRVIAEGIVDEEGLGENSFIIDKGLSSGLVVGLPALSSQGIMIGKITECKENISRISLLTSSDCKVAATVQGQVSTMGVTEGELGLTLKMNFISQDKNIKVNDVVVTSGLEKNVPKGLILGKVVQVENKKNEIWQSVIIEPLLDYKSLDLVSVIVP